MSGNQNNGLHLSDLSVQNFRGIQDLTIKKLGRVTLIAGRNGVGKTSVLDALRVYATRGSREEFDRLLRRKEEYAVASHIEQIFLPDYAALFFGRQAIRESPISIGSVSSDQNRLEIHVKTVEDLFFPEQELLVRNMFDPEMKILRIQFQNGESMLSLECGKPELTEQLANLTGMLRRLGVRRAPGLPAPIACTSLGPGLPNNRMLVNSWNKIALTEEESIPLEALGVAKMPIDRITLIQQGNDGHTHAEGSYFVVKHQNYAGRVPLKSLGDGITRLFATGLALAVSRNGFLLIDEVENGLHYSVIKHIWTMTMKVAQDYNIQVFATTHSFDCIQAFAEAADENKETESVLVRLGREQEKTHAVEYTEEELKVAGEQGIEVR